MASKNLIDYQIGGFKKWHWQYSDNPACAHTDLPAWLAVSGGEIAGHLGAIPVKLKITSRLIDAAWMVDFVTLPQHRRKGIGRLLVREAGRHYETLMTAGQTDASFNLFIKMGWKYLGDIPNYIRILDMSSLAKEKNKNSPALLFLFTALDPIIKIFNHFRKPKNHKDIEVGKTDAFGEEGDRFWKKIADSYKVIIPRDGSYINWKYAAQPGMDYVMLRAVRDNAVCGYVIIRVITNKTAKPTGLIADMIVRHDDADAIDALLSAALKYFEDEGCSMVRCYASHRSIKKALTKGGFIRHRVKMRFLINKYVDGLDEMKELDNWYLTAGDCDIDRA